MRKVGSCLAGCTLVCLACSAAAAAVRLSGPISVDFRPGCQRTVTDVAADIRYSPAWAGGTATGVNVLKITGIGSASVVTTTVATATAEGVFSLPAETEPVRLVHQAVAADGTVLDEQVRDVAFGVSHSSETFFADATTNGLQRLADVNAKTFVRYDASWMSGGRSVCIDMVKTPLADGAIAVTNRLFSGTGAGKLPLSLFGRAAYALRLSFFGTDGEPVGDVWMADYTVWGPYGAVMIVR